MKKAAEKTDQDAAELFMAELSYPQPCTYGSESAFDDALSGALISAVLPFSPADDAGFEPGCHILRVDGHPLRDIIDWRWLTDGDLISVDYVDREGDSGMVELEREEGEDWGFVFAGAIFDEVKRCRNTCTFCFMRQLPEGMRPSLSLRDDDYRLSFLSGNFITLTNVTGEDEARIKEQVISPLRVSIHAVDREVRRKLIGNREAHGVAVLERLLQAGIEVHAQIVLLPGINDGPVLEETLAWASQRPGILTVGIVPLGFTRYQTRFHHSFTEPRAALEVLHTIAPFQRRALKERGSGWVYAADEFYRNAYGSDLLAHLPPASHYGENDLFEDGIGMIRGYVDEFQEAVEIGLAERVAQCLRARDITAVMVIGEAMQPLLMQLLEASPLAGHITSLTVRNHFFGGNVNVTGLLCGGDITAAIERNASQAYPATKRYLIPRVVFNDDGLTLDDMTLEEIGSRAHEEVAVVSCSPLAYLKEILVRYASGSSEK